MGGWYEVMPPSQFWMINAVIVGGAGAALLVLRGPLLRYFGPEDDQPAGSDAASPLPA